MYTPKPGIPALALLCLALAGSSWGQPTGSGPEGRKFPISIADAEARAAEVFASIDSNADDKISSDEFAAAELPRDHDRRGAHHRFWHDRAHRDRHEHPRDAAHSERRKAHEAALFEALDTDGNGQLSPEEFAHERQREARRSLMKSHAFERLDKDDDGFLSGNEFSQRLARLKELDADGNGEVSRDEFRDGMRARHRRDS